VNEEKGNIGYSAQVQKSAAELLRLINIVTSASNKFSDRINAFNSQPISNQSEAEKVAVAVAPDFNLYAMTLAGVVQGIKENAFTLTKSYSAYISSVELKNEESQSELAAINYELKGLLDTLKTTKSNIKELQEAAYRIHNRNINEQLNQATLKLVIVVDKLFSAYEEIETFGLNISFAIDEKTVKGDQEERQQELSHNKRLGKRTNIKTFVLDNALLQYQSKFQKPVFSLWKNQEILLENIYNLVSPFDVGLDDINIEGENDIISEKAVVVFFEGLGTLKFGYEEILWESEGDSLNNISDIFDILTYISEKLPSIAPDLKYGQHLLEYGGHGALESGQNFQEILYLFHSPVLNSIEQNLPSGIMLNWLDTSNHRRFHFEIDESLDVPGNIYMRWVVIFNTIGIEPTELREIFFVPLLTVLAELNLQLVD
jgi:hypothetical protein